MKTALFIFTSPSPGGVLLVVSAIDRDHAHDVLERWVFSEDSGPLGLLDHQFLAEIPGSAALDRRPGVQQVIQL